MSGGANRALLSNPKQWLSRNVLIVEVNPTGAATVNKSKSKVVDHTSSGHYIAEGKILSLDIVKAEDTATDSAGNQIEVYKVVRGGGIRSPFSNQFKAFYLPWQQNGKKLMTLDAGGVNWFFTDTMNGCSFAAGPGDKPKVGHFNYQIDNTAIDNAKISQQIGMEFSGGVHTRLDKARYMDKWGMNKVTTLGFRENGSWKFYYQVREIVSQIPPKWKLVSGPNSVPR